MPKPKVALPENPRDPITDAVRIGPADPSEKIVVTILVRPKEPALPVAHHGARMRPDESTAVHGASAEDFFAVREFAREYNLEPRNENPGARTIELYGTVADFSRAFGVSLDHVKLKDKDQIIRQRNGPIHIPEDLLPIVQGVFGLDTRTGPRPQLSAHLLATKKAPSEREP